MASTRVAGVVLAAGTGRRMGRPKALVEVDGTPLVVSAVATLRDGGCDPVAVVTGAAHDEVAPLVAAQAGVAVVRNPSWADGQAASVRAALAWASGTDAAGLLVVPVDTPGITGAVVRRVVQRWTDAPDLPAVATYDGRARNPVLLPAALWPDVAARVQGDAGARHWLRDNAVQAVDCTDLGDPTDLDTPQDLTRWRGRTAAPTRGDAHGADPHVHRPGPA